MEPEMEINEITYEEIIKPRPRGRPPKPKPEIIEPVEPSEPKKRGRKPKPKPEIVEPSEPKKRGRKSPFATDEERQAHTKEYFQKYWLERYKKPATCIYCNKVFSSRIALGRHARTNNKKCTLIRFEKEINELKNRK